MKILDKIWDETEEMIENIENAEVGLDVIQEKTERWDTKEIHEIVTSLKGEFERLTNIIKNIKKDLEELVTLRAALNQIGRKEFLKDAGLADQMLIQNQIAYTKGIGFLKYVDEELDRIDKKTTRMLKIIYAFNKYIKFHVHLFYVYIQNQEKLFESIAEEMDVVKKGLKKGVLIPSSSKFSPNNTIYKLNVESVEQSILNAGKHLGENKTLPSMIGTLEEGKTLFYKIDKQIVWLSEFFKIHHTLEPKERKEAIKKAKETQKLIAKDIKELHRIAKHVQDESDKFLSQFTKIINYKGMITQQNIFAKKHAGIVYNEIHKYCSDINKYITLVNERPTANAQRKRHIMRYLIGLRNNFDEIEEETKADENFLILRT